MYIHTHIKHPTHLHPTAAAAAATVPRKPTPSPAPLVTPAPPAPAPPPPPSPAEAPSALRRSPTAPKPSVSVLEPPGRRRCCRLLLVHHRGVSHVAAPIHEPPAPDSDTMGGHHRAVFVGPPATAADPERSSTGAASGNAGRASSAARACGGPCGSRYNWLAVPKHRKHQLLLLLLWKGAVSRAGRVHPVPIHHAAAAHVEASPGGLLLEVLLLLILGVPVVVCVAPVQGSFRRAVGSRGFVAFPSLGLLTHRVPVQA